MMLITRYPKGCSIRSHFFHKGVSASYKRVVESTSSDIAQRTYDNVTIRLNRTIAGPYRNILIAAVLKFKANP